MFVIIRLCFWWVNRLQCFWMVTIVVTYLAQKVYRYGYVWNRFFVVLLYEMMLGPKMFWDINDPSDCKKKKGIFFFFFCQSVSDSHYYSDFSSCFIVGCNCRGKDDILLGVFVHLFCFGLVFFFYLYFFLLQVRKWDV